MATSSICEAAVPKSRAVHICMKGRSRVRSEKLGEEAAPAGTAEAAGGKEAGAGSGPDIRSRIAEAS
ncbi:Uncharacterised protein [Mycobacterium tuberculosis]|nr:Uncharacterised protein [Mycobacterium tuberculosis]